MMESDIQNVTVLTLCVVCDADHILLGMKKRGFGAGKWNGFGGKVGEGESIEDAAIRECQEEAGIIPVLEPRGVIHFEYEGDGKVHKVHVFYARSFSGEVRETEEMRPSWFSVQDIPYDRMWPDDVYWLPSVLEGARVSGTFRFNDKGEIVSFGVSCG